MYSMNLAASLLKRSKAKSIFIRFLQILNILFQILIILLLISSFFINKSAKKYENDSRILKKTIFEQINSKNVDETLKFWQEDTFKLSVIKKHIEKSSRYGIVMKELGNYLPEGDLVHAVAIEGSVVELILKVNKSNLVKKNTDADGKKINTDVDYANVLKKQFEKSLCFASGKITVEKITVDEKNTDSKLDKNLKLFDIEVKNLPKNPTTAVFKVTTQIDESKKDE